MNREDILRMAREAFAVECIVDEDVPRLERFAALVADEERERVNKAWLIVVDAAVQAEREACEKVCIAFAEEAWENYKRGAIDGSTGRADPNMMGRTEGAEECATRIRARGEK